MAVTPVPTAMVEASQPAYCTPEGGLLLRRSSEKSLPALAYISAAPPPTCCSLGPGVLLLHELESWNHRVVTLEASCCVLTQWAAVAKYGTNDPEVLLRMVPVQRKVVPDESWNV